MTSDNKPICHACRNYVVKRDEKNVIVDAYCGLKFKSPWMLMPRTVENTAKLRAASVVAVSKGISDFDPLKYIAVSKAGASGTCKYFKKP